MLQRVSIALIVSFSLLGSATVVRGEPKDPKIKLAAQRGLDWLVGEQHRSGYWEANQGQYRVAMTALSANAMLCEGSTTTRGRLAKPIAKAVEAANNDAILMAFNVEAVGKDDAPVIEVTRLFTTEVPEFSARARVRANAVASRADTSGLRVHFSGACGGRGDPSRWPPHSGSEQDRLSETMRCAAQPTPAVMQELEAHVRGQLEAVTEAGLIDDPTPAPEEDEEDTLESDLAEGLDFGQVMPS
jgi:hypothetical protein